MISYETIETKEAIEKANTAEYVAIQDLRIGDSIKTYLHGNIKIKLIGKRTMVNSKDLLKSMFIWKKNDNNNLIEDLIVTGGHSILVDKINDEDIIYQNRFRPLTMLDDKILELACNDKDFVQIDDEDLYTYYHICLENNDMNVNYGIWANGILTESICENHYISHNFFDL